MHVCLCIFTVYIYTLSSLIPYLYANLLEKGHNEFEVKLSVATNEVTELKKRCQGLQEGIRAMTDELQLMKSDIQEKVVALKKAEIQNKTLSKRDKVPLCVCVCVLCMRVCLCVCVCVHVHTCVVCTFTDVVRVYV